MNYKSVRHSSDAVVSGMIETSDTIYDLMQSGFLTPNAVWDNSNVYAGAQINDNSYTGCYSVLGWKNDFIHYNSYSAKTPASVVNLRWFYGWHSSSSPVSIYYSYMRWTGLSEDYVDVYKNTAPYKNFKVYSYPLSEEIEKSIDSFADNHFNQTPITKLNLNDMVFLATFRITTVTLTPYNEEYKLYSKSTSDQDLTWLQVKPEDETEQGSYYDNDLWNTGYKITKNNDGSIEIKYCAGVRLDSYYGKSDWVYASDTGRYKDGTTQQRAAMDSTNFDNYPYAGSSRLNWGTPNCLLEMYVPELNSVVYCNLPGIFWDASPNDAVFSGSTNLTDKNGTAFKSDNFDYLFKSYSDSLVNIMDKKGDEIEPEEIANTFQIINLFKEINASGNIENFGSLASLRQRLTDNQSNFVSVEGYTSQIYWDLPGYFSIKKLWGTIATLGCYVTGDESTALYAQTSKNVDSPYLYCGEMLNDGTTTGVMVQGKAIHKLPQTEMDDITDTPFVPVNPSPFTPDPDPDENVPDEHTGSTSPHGAFNVGGVQGFITMYALSNAEVQLFGMGLWDSISTGDILSNFFKLGSDDMAFSYGDILEYVISLKFFPFDLNSVGVTILNARGETGIRMGTGKVLVPVNSTVRPIVYSSTCELDGGYCTIPAKQSSYLDCEPVAVATLYVPFCGTTDITLSAVTDYQLHLRYFVDLITGCCTAIVEMSTSNGYQPIAELQGVVGFDILITGTNKNHQLSSVLSSLRHSALAVGGSIGSAVVGGVTGNPAMLIGGIAGAAGTIADQAIDMPKTAELHPMSAGSASSLNALCSYHTAWIQIKRHNPEINNSFGRSIGYLSNKSVTIGSCSGFTQVTNPNLSGIPATADELAIIKEILTSGFYA